MSSADNHKLGEEFAVKVRRMIQRDRRAGEVHTVEHSLRGTNPHLKNLGDAEVRAVLDKSVQSNIDVEK